MLKKLLILVSILVTMTSCTSVGILSQIEPSKLGSTNCLNNYFKKENIKNISIIGETSLSYNYMLDSGNKISDKKNIQVGKKVAELIKNDFEKKGYIVTYSDLMTTGRSYRSNVTYRIEDENDPDYINFERYLTDIQFFTSNIFDTTENTAIENLIENYIEFSGGLKNYSVSHAPYSKAIAPDLKVYSNIDWLTSKFASDNDVIALFVLNGEEELKKNPSEFRRNLFAPKIKIGSIGGIPISAPMNTGKIAGSSPVVTEIGLMLFDCGTGNVVWYNSAYSRKRNISEQNIEECLTQILAKFPAK